MTSASVIPESLADVSSDRACTAVAIYPQLPLTKGRGDSVIVLVTQTMLVEGLLEEVNQLLCDGILTSDCMGAKAIGYRQVTQGREGRGEG